MTSRHGKDQNPSSGGTTPAPGDDALPGTPGAGENVCPQCGGSGKVEGKACQACEGTGKVIEGIGGG